MSEVNFQAGDRVVIGGNLVAEIVSVSDDGNFVYKHRVGAEGWNTVYGAHVVNTKVELLQAVAAPAEEPVAEEPAEASTGDQFIAGGSL